jgi:hypothetical protein
LEKQSLGVVETCSLSTAAPTRCRVTNKIKRSGNCWIRTIRGPLRLLRRIVL